MRWDDQVVKELPNGSPERLPKRGFRRHFEGYELGLATLGMVLTFALLALPRASLPLTLPLPRVDRGDLHRRERAERELATHTEAEGLPFEVRAVGEAMRRVGRASAHGFDTSHDQDDLRARASALLRAGQTALLLRLRAVQTEYFLRALRQFERDRAPSSELDELGGDFVAHAQQSGWLDQRGRWLSDETSLRVLFRVRWADLIGQRATFPFGPSLDEWRVYYAFLLRYPERDPTRASADDATRLRLANALAKKDPDYPVDLARGYLLHQLGDTEAAATAYRRYLGTHDGGPYALLARNYLIYTLQGVSSE